MDGNQVGKHQRPVELLLAGAGLPGVDDDRYRGRDPLVAAARVDDDGQLAAPHPGIGTRGGGGFGPADGVVRQGGVPDHLADAGPIAVGQPLLGDGHVAGDLTVQQLPHIVNIHRQGKVVDIRHGEKGAVGETALVVLLHRQVQQHLTVVLQVDNVGVVVGNADLDLVVPPAQGEADVKDQVAVQKLHPDGVLL